MQHADQGPIGPLDGSGLRIGIVQARFNHALTEALAQACRLELHALGVRDDDVMLVQVPGALEVPVALQALAAQSGFDALVALGCIVRGETYHFELVANESGAGVSRVSLDAHLPIANAILTVENEAQAWARAADKGRDAARVAVEMARLLGSLGAAGETGATGSTGSKGASGGTGARISVAAAATATTGTGARAAASSKAAS